METITKTLIMEHAVFNQVFDQIEKAMADTHTAAEVRLMGKLVEGMLAAHGAAETDLAYSALDHALAEKGLLDGLNQDHREIDNHYLRVHQTEDLAEARRRLHRALSATREHFRREERIVFPLLEQNLKPETLWLLGGKRMEGHASRSRA